MPFWIRSLLMAPGDVDSMIETRHPDQASCWTPSQAPSCAMISDRIHCLPALLANGDEKLLPAGSFDLHRV